MVKEVKIVIEKHPEGYVAYSLGLNGLAVGEGDTYEEALPDMKSAIQFHARTFGTELGCHQRQPREQPDGSKCEEGGGDHVK